MRGTTKISNSNSLYYINKNFNSLMKVSNQIALEQQVINLEDDPLSANIGIKMLSIISKSEQYNTNIKTGIGALNLTDGYLGSCKTLMDKIKTIATGASNDPTDSSGRAANAIELNEILKSLVSAGNAHDGSRYVFGGQNTTTPPFTIVNSRYVNYTGNDSSINIKADNGTTIAINCTGTQAYGNMITKIPSRDLNPDVSLSTDRSTKLSDLNGGDGVPKGKITVYYSAYPEGLEIDLSGCDTLEDVKDTIERTTLEASRALNVRDCSWIDGSNLDWHDLQDRYVKVTVNPEHNGISLQEFDLGEPLPEPTAEELKKGLSYSGAAGYVNPGDLGINHGGTANVETTVFDKPDTIYQSKPNSYYSPLRVENHANNRVAEALGIKGTAVKFNPDAGGDPTDPVNEGFLHGKDLNPRVSASTLLADLEGYNDSTYTFTNGTKPGTLIVRENPGQDTGNVFNEWKLSGVSKGDNTGANGELYARAVNRGTATDPDIVVEIYSCPISKAKASDLVATGTYTGSGSGGTVVLNEANSSGVSGTVGIVLPSTIKEESVDLTIEFGDNLTASVHVPAFIEESTPDGISKDLLNIFSGWNIRGLDKPPANSYDRNHPASTDLDGDVSVNYRLETDSTGNSYFVVELCRPAYNDQPAQLIASGRMHLGDGNGPPLGNAVSGRIEFVGADGFEGVKGSVYIELPSGTNFNAASTQAGVGSANATTATYQLQANAAAGTIYFGGATELKNTIQVNPGVNGIKLTGDTVFKKGQQFLQDVQLANGGVIKAGTIIDRDIMVPKGTTVFVNEILEGTVIPEGQELTTTSDLAAGTVIPRGSYYSSPAGTGFPAGSMGVRIERTDAHTGNPIIIPDDYATGFDLRATFATVEDFNRAVEQAGIYVTANISEDGKGIEFQSSLAGAYLTVSEDTDCYEQMGDKYQQLTGLNLSGLVSGVNADKNGNVYTEVIYYPPNPPPRDKEKVQLTSENGNLVEVDPGYYVRVYSDPDEMQKSYENRDNTKMVAEGFVPLGNANPAFNAALPITAANFPYLPAGSTTGLGFMDNLVLQERNESGVWGTVNLDYYGNGPVADTNANGEIVYDFRNNDGITVFPGGLRPEGSRRATIQEWDIYNPTPGVNTDYAGTVHGEITKNSASATGYDIRLYKDTSHGKMTAKSDPAEGLVDGKIRLYEVDQYGNIALDANGDRIVAGYMAVPGDSLPEGETDSFKLTTGAIRNSSQEREENVFSTINDLIDALNQNDLEKIHDLIGSAQRDITHILEARGDVAARTDRLTMLSERHADDIVKFKSTLVSRVGMDDQALAMAVLNYQAATNAYQAAMQVSGQLMQMSLLQFI